MNDMKKHLKIGLRPNHLLLLRISIDITILENMFQMTKETGHVAVSDWIKSTADQT